MGGGWFDQGAAEEPALHQGPSAAAPRPPELSSASLNNLCSHEGEDPSFTREGRTLVTVTVTDY